jgi:hypothetical protein
MLFTAASISCPADRHAFHTICRRARSIRSMSGVPSA